MTYTDSHVCCAVRANRMWWKAFERVALGQHKSFYPHRTQFAAVEQIIEVGDIWNYSLSALESYHAEVGRVADRSGCKRVEIEQGEAKT